MAKENSLMCEKMDYSFEGIRTSEGSVRWEVGGTKGYHTDALLQKLPSSSAGIGVVLCGICLRSQESLAKRIAKYEIYICIIWV